MNYVLKHAKPNVDKVLACWRCYKAELGEELPSWREYVANVESKMVDPGYRNGMDGLLRPVIEFNAVTAWANVKSGIVDRLMTERDRAELANPTRRDISAAGLNSRHCNDYSKGVLTITAFCLQRQRHFSKAPNGILVRCIMVFW